MIHRSMQLNFIVTPFFHLRVSEATAKAMDEAYPGWDSMWIDERTKEGKRAQEGRDRLIEVANFVSELNWRIGAEMSEL